ncbi:MAG TPA: ribosome maturation factor RimM [Candidatus Binatia bacterium]|nr:ribosome maturation factor RimM [Candidatus Binatia bacterium]
MTPNDSGQAVVVGRIAGVFGVRGELKCDPTSAGRIVFSPGAVLDCARGDARTPIRLAAVRPHGGRLLIRITGVEDAASAENYAGALLYAARDRISLSEGEYLDDDLVGCSVLGKDGTAYGTVQRVEHYPSSDMLIVDGTMVPMVRSIVSEIEVAKRRIVIDPPLGLFEQSSP